MNISKDFVVYQPNEVPNVPGVFVIARYVGKNSTELEHLYCNESEDIKSSAQKVMAEKKFDGFDHPIVYLIQVEYDPKRRIELLQDLKF